MELTTVWFAAIAFLWTGYFVLEGFDFGVGMLTPLLGHTEPQRRTLLSTIAPVWDGNEVWLITAIGATFAAFPHWYATLLSGFYLPLLAVIVALICRGLGLEYRSKRDDPRWKARWTTAIAAGSALPAFTWGVIFANTTAGIPITHLKEYAGPLLGLLTPYALLGGTTTLAFAATHGATFLAVKTNGDLRARAHTTAQRLAPATLVVTTAFLTWTITHRPHALSIAAAALTLTGLAAVLLAVHNGRDGWAFVGTTTATASLIATLFTNIYPAVLPSTLNPAWSLTIHNAAATPYTLTVMTWAAVVFLPLVIGYQAWTYWVFRTRVTTEPS